MQLQKKTMAELERISKDAFAEAKKIPVILILDNVRSMNNVGSVFRSADVFVVEAIYLCGITPQPPHRDINKTALGATDTVHWQYFNTVQEAIADAKNKAYIITAIEQVHNSIQLEQYEIDRKKGYALIFGNEVDGVSDEALQLCHTAIEIAQAGSKHSLNISVTVGIISWYFYSKMLGL